MRFHNHIRSKMHFGANDGKRANMATRANLRARLDHR
jgi:hypothetical protein